MVKKLLSLSLVAVMLFTVAFTAVMYAEPTYAAAADAIAVVANNATINDKTGLQGTVTLNLASTEARDSALLITAVYDDGGAMLNAEINEVASVAEEDNEVIVNLPTALTDENNKYIVKFFWWESKASLVPVAECASITVTPAAAKWTGYAATEELSQDAAGYYRIENGEDLALFANKVNGGETTAKAKLVNSIYLNYFEDEDGKFDEDWYENPDYTTDEASETWTSQWNNSETAFYMNNFAGEFDGDGYTIYGLYIIGGQGIGFFGSGFGGTVKNVTFKGAYVESTSTSATNVHPIGVAVADATDGTTIDNVTTYGKIKPQYSVNYVSTVGGILGRATGNVTVSNSKSYVNIDGTACSGSAVVKSKNFGIGGIVGTTGLGTTKTSLAILNCENYGDIIVPNNWQVGGILGYAYNDASVYVTFGSTCGNAGKIRAGAFSDGVTIRHGEIYGFKGKNSTLNGHYTDTLSEGSADIYNPEID